MLYRFANGCCVPHHPSRCDSTPSSAWANSARRGFYLLIDHANERQQKTSCRSQEVLVEHRRFELLTPTLPVLCATSCANAPRTRMIIARIPCFVKRFFHLFLFLLPNRIDIPNNSIYTMVNGLMRSTGCRCWRPQCVRGKGGQLT